MLSNSTQRAWYLLCFFPSGAAVIVATLVALVFKFQPGGDPADAFAITFTLAEGMMLAAALGILGTFKTKIATMSVKWLRIINILIIIASGATGYYTFMKMTGAI